METGDPEKPVELHFVLFMPFVIVHKENIPCHDLVDLRRNDLWM